MLSVNSSMFNLTHKTITVQVKLHLVTAAQSVSHEMLFCYLWLVQHLL